MSVSSGVTLATRIHAISYACDDVLLFELRSLDGEPLPAFTPGAHVDVHIPGGMSRSYSLLNDAAERHRYLLGIKRESASRGGSAWMHDVARPGEQLEIAGPRNHFALDESAPHSVLIAGGIGITPLWSMAQRLQALQRPGTLHYRARSRRTAPLLDELTRADLACHVAVSFSDEAPGRRLDITKIVADAPAGSHFYCCGPVPMMESFQQACSHLDPACVHLEYFAAKEEAATEGGYTVRLAKSGREIVVKPGETILASLQAAGVAVPSSCQQGVCGACEMRVLSGTPDHRDLVLSDAEKAAGATMMICCSGSLTAELVLDA